MPPGRHCRRPLFVGTVAWACYAYGQLRDSPQRRTPRALGDGARGLARASPTRTAASCQVRVLPAPSRGATGRGEATECAGGQRARRRWAHYQLGVAANHPRLEERPWRAEHRVGASPAQVALMRVLVVIANAARPLRRSSGGTSDCRPAGWCEGTLQTRRCGWRETVRRALRREGAKSITPATMPLRLQKRTASRIARYESAPPRADGPAPRAG